MKYYLVINVNPLKKKSDVLGHIFYDKNYAEKLLNQLIKNKDERYHFELLEIELEL